MRWLRPYSLSSSTRSQCYPHLSNYGSQMSSLPPKRYLTTYLDLLVQQVQGQVLKRDPSSGEGAGLAEQVWDISGIPGLAPRVDVLQGLEVIVQCVPHHHLALQQLKDLWVERGGGKSPLSGRNTPKLSYHWCTEPSPPPPATSGRQQWEREERVHEPRQP